MVKEDWGELSAINRSLKKIEEFIQIMIWLPAWLQNQPFNSSKLGVWMPGILNAVSWNHTLLHPSYLPSKNVSSLFSVFCAMLLPSVVCQVTCPPTQDSLQLSAPFSFSQCQVCTSAYVPTKGDYCESIYIPPGGLTRSQTSSNKADDQWRWRNLYKTEMRIPYTREL